MLFVMLYWVSFAFFAVISALLSWGALKTFPHLRLLDFPERYGLKRNKIPYPGGIILLFLILFLIFYFNLFLWIFIPLLLLGSISFLDDKKPLPIWIRLIVHLIVAFWVYTLGVRIDFVGNPFSPGTSINLSQWEWIPILLTLAWIVIIQNAMNWFDGIKGLSVGISGIGFLTLGFFGLLRKEVIWEQSLPDFLFFTFSLAGICVGAFLFFWRGKIILGDTGSQILGFLLAVLSLVAGTKIAVTLLVLCLPLLDSVMVVVRRIFFEKKSPFSGDQKHIHHNIAHKIGEERATLLLILLSTLFGSIALFLTGLQKIIALFFAALLVLLLNIWGLKKNRPTTNKSFVKNLHHSTQAKAPH